MPRRRIPHAPQRLRRFARGLRRGMTDTERKLWPCLRARQIGSTKFRRQVPIGNYIVDFVCLEQKLIVELDGGQHASQQKADAQRTAWLECRGFKVLRFWDSDVFENLDGVLEAIAREIETAGGGQTSSRKKRSPSCAAGDVPATPQSGSTPPP